MASIEDLNEIYESFCSFGSSRTNLSGSDVDMSGSQMDGTKFAKFTKDCKIQDGKKVTSTDVDILFNKCKEKGARKLDWTTFQDAFQQLSQMRFPDKTPRDAYTSLLVHIIDKGPIARGTVRSPKFLLSYPKFTCYLFRLPKLAAFMIS